MIEVLLYEHTELPNLVSAVEEIFSTTPIQKAALLHHLGVVINAPFVRKLLDELKIAIETDIHPFD